MFWERLCELCTIHNCKPNTIAKDIGLSSAIATKWKNEGTLPNGETLIKIANYLNCSVDYLLGRTDNLIENTPSLTVDSTTYKILTISQSLPEAQKEELLSFARYLKEKQSL